jgi:hypothetical protein
VSVTTDNGLAVLTKAERMLAEVVTAQDAIDIVDMAEAARVWAQRAKLGTASINHATAIKLKAEIKLADCVDEGQRRGAIAPPSGGRPKAQETVTTGNGLTLPPATLGDLGLTGKKVHEARKIRDAFTPEAIDEIVTSANLQDKEIARKEFVQQRAHVAYNGGENEWYTPTHFVDAARRVMGSIDVDPASNPQAQGWIQATRYFTKDDSGLDKDWHGNVWMNPPYAQPLISQFCEKVAAEHESGRVTQAVVLVNNGTETKWGQRLLAVASAVCFPTGRIKFIDQNGDPGAPLQGQMFVYLGADADAFHREFAEFGTVLRGR